MRSVRRNHNHAVIQGSWQNVFACGPIHKMLLDAWRAERVSGKVLADLKVFQEETGAKPVGKIDVLRNVVCHSVGLGFLVGHQRCTKKYLQGNQTVGADVVLAVAAAAVVVHIAGLDLGLHGGIGVKKGA
jgi:hypothetical protein